MDTNTFELTYSSYENYRCKYRGKQLQLKHRLSCLSQWLSKPEFGVIGGYHYGNAGDIALGESLVNCLSASEQAAKLQTIYNLNSWPATKYAMLGGGAITYENVFANVYDRYRKNPERLAIMGVDMQGIDSLLKYEDFLKDVAYISCRSSQQVEMLRSKLNREDVVYHQDLCVSRFDVIAPQPSKSRAKVLGVNMVPYFMRMDKHCRFVSGARDQATLKSSFPELLPYVDQLGELYVRFFRRMCEHYQSLGYEILHLPFTPQDDLFARSALAGMGVQFRSYTTVIDKMLEEIRGCSAFLCTRFHSLIFASITQTPMIPFLYAIKCRRYSKDMNLEERGLVTIHDLLDAFESTCERVISQGPILAPTDQLEQASSLVRSSVKDAYNSLGI